MTGTGEMILNPLILNPSLTEDPAPIMLTTEHGQFRFMPQNQGLVVQDSPWKRRLEERMRRMTNHPEGRSPVRVVMQFLLLVSSCRSRTSSLVLPKTVKHSRDDSARRAHPAGLSCVG